MPKQSIALIHASRASLDPLMRHYPAAAPELELVNLLDDGVMKLFAKGDNELATRRLTEMVATGRDLYGAELALLCCSAVTKQMLAEIGAAAGIHLLKIDVPMTRMAVAAGARIGVIVTFPPTQAITHALLDDAAAEAGKSIELLDELQPKAVEAILAGDRETHDRIMMQAGQRLADSGAECIVLAQVSMAHLVEPLKAATGLPVFSSLETSLVAVKQTLGLA
jgi:aspartate/glutamate racemase